MDEFIARIGTFLLLMGVTLALLFVASDATAAYNPAKQADYNYLFFALLSLSLGYIFRKKAAPPPAADRFKGIRKIRENAKKRQEEKAKAKQAKQQPKKN